MTFIMRRFPWFLLVLLLPLLGRSGSAAPAEESPAVPPPPEGFSIHGDAEAGRAEFLKKCAVCHGENGDGNGRIRLDPPARDLRDGERMGRRSDWELYLVIRDGGKVLGLSEKMLPWGNLVSEQELHDLVAFVRSLASGSAASDSGAEDGGGPPS